MDVPRFPASIDELDEWSVYADFLMTRGDRRGDLIAHELALGDPVDPAAVREFQALARPICRQPRSATFGYCLGHIRAIAVSWGWGPIGRRTAPDASALAQLRNVLGTPAGSRLEALALAVVEGENRWHLRQLLGALPPSCRRVELRIAGPWTSGGLAEVFAQVPAHVREVAVAGEWPVDWTAALPAVIADRFDVVALACGQLDRVTAEALAAAVSATSHVRLRVDAWAGAFAGVRAALGAPGDAALIRDDARRALAIPRWPLVTLQSHYGVVPVRTQLAGGLAEGLAVSDGTDQVSTAAARAGAYLMRRADRWTVREPDQPPRPIALGDRLALGDGRWRLVTAEHATRMLRPDLHGASDQ